MKNNDAAIGLSGVWSLTKINSETGEIIEHIEQSKNEFTTAGLQHAAARLSSPSTSATMWDSDNLVLDVYGATGNPTEISDGQAIGNLTQTVSDPSVSVDVGTTPASGTFVVSWTDPGHATSGNSYTPSTASGRGVAPKIGSTTIARNLNVGSWGTKNAGDTWVFTWTITATFTGGGSNPVPTVGPGNMLNRIKGTLTSSARVQASNDSGSSQNFDLDLTNVTESSLGVVYTITSQRQGDSNEYSLYGEAIGWGSGQSGDFFIWRFQSETEAAVNETITVTHTFTFSEA